MGEDERGPHRGGKSFIFRGAVCCGYIDAMSAMQTVLQVDPNKCSTGAPPPKNRFVYGLSQTDLEEVGAEYYVTHRFFPSEIEGLIRPTPPPATQSEPTQQQQNIGHRYWRSTARWNRGQPPDPAGRLPKTGSTMSHKLLKSFLWIRPQTPITLPIHVHHWCSTAAPIHRQRRTRSTLHPKRYAIPGFGCWGLGRGAIWRSQIGPTVSASVSERTHGALYNTNCQRSRHTSVMFHGETPQISLL